MKPDLDYHLFFVGLKEIGYKGSGVCIYNIYIYIYIYMYNSVYIDYIYMQITEHGKHTMNQEA